MFEYFQSYPWNLAMLTALAMGAVPSEVDEVCRPLREKSDTDSDATTASWVDAWRSLGDKLERQAQRDEPNAILSAPGENICAQPCTI